MFRTFLNVVRLQETHFTPETLQNRKAALQSLGWNLFAEPATASEKDTRLGGGTAIAYPKNSGVREKTLYQHQGAGFVSVGLRQGSWDYIVISLHRGNKRPPWCPMSDVLGDWSVDPTEVQDTTICQVMRGRLLATEEALQPRSRTGQAL